LVSGLSAYCSGRQAGARRERHRIRDRLVEEFELPLSPRPSRMDGGTVDLGPDLDRCQFCGRKHPEVRLAISSNTPCLVDGKAVPAGAVCVDCFNARFGSPNVSAS
jgi:hypothetical protein